MASETEKLEQMNVGFPATDLEFLRLVAERERLKLSHVIRRIVGKRVDELRAEEEGGA
jgi:hypothetical protein